MSYLFPESPYFPGNVGGRWPEMTTHIPGPLVDLVASTEDTIKKGVATTSYVLVHIQFKKARDPVTTLACVFRKVICLLPCVVERQSKETLSCFPASCIFLPFSGK